MLGRFALASRPIVRLRLYRDRVEQNHNRNLAHRSANAEGGLPGKPLMPASASQSSGISNSRGWCGIGYRVDLRTPSAPLRPRPGPLAHCPRAVRASTSERWTTSPSRRGGNAALFIACICWQRTRSEPPHSITSPAQATRCLRIADGLNTITRRGAWVLPSRSWDCGPFVVLSCAPRRSRTRTASPSRHAQDNR
jgi:hypothetical protein